MEYVEFRELKTRRLVLRKLRMEDVKGYFDRLGSSEAVTRYMLWNPHKDISESVASIQKTLHRYEEGKCYRWGVARQEDDSIIGVIELLRFNEAANTCSFAYMLAEEFWGHGYGTEMLSAALEFAFTYLKIDVVEADHMADNRASGAVMRKVGMKYLRTDTSKYEKNGTTYDAPVYRITADGWKNSDSLTLHAARGDCIRL